MTTSTQAHTARGGGERALLLSRCALLVLSGDHKGQKCVFEGHGATLPRIADLCN